MKKVTIEDIARIAGVSKSTVSRVVNGSAKVNPRKKEAVMDAIKRLGFKPNVFAQSLAKGQSMTIGVLTQLIGSPFFDSVAQGVVAGLADTKYSPIFVDGQWEKESELAGIRALLGRRVDGLLLIGGSVPGSEIADLCRDIPTVVIARRLASDQHRCIFMDNVEAGYLVTQHLIENNHRRIAFVRGLANHTDAVERYHGYEQALREANIELDESLVLDGDFSAECGVRAVDHLVNNSISFTAMFCSNDTTAFGARLAMHRHGISVPEDVSLVGFDDQGEAAFVVPPLTTFRQPAREMGEEGAQYLLGILAGNKPTVEPLHGKLIKRESVALAKV
ncbi:MAG TPA: transcriptional regulator [Planctomycetaceae bacterium]|nr:transcriptional regulator [Planctomycetaceae bacterium]